MVNALLEAGADVDPATTTTGVQPIHLGAESANAEVIRTLVQHGADVNARERSWGHTPLVFAASQNRTEVIRALMELGDPYAAFMRPRDRNAALLNANYGGVGMRILAEEEGVRHRQY